MCLGRRALLCACLAAGCGKNEAIEPISSTVEGCKEQFAASKGYGYSVDRSAAGSTPTATTNGVGGAQAERSDAEPSLELAILECRRGIAVGAAGASGIPVSDMHEQSRGLAGTNCEYPQIMTHDAALCVAAVHGLDEAQGYAATIGYRSDYRRIAWAVNNTLERADGTLGGEVVTFDATTGEVFESTSWSAP